MSLADLQPALSTGAVDGQENPVNLFLAFRMDTLAQKHLSVWNYVNDPLVFAAGKQVMAQFNAADQALVRDCALEAGRYEIGVTRKGLGEGGDRSSFDELAKRGVEATILTDAEKRAFATATRPVFDKWAATIGHDLVARAEAVIRAAA
jgi:TRAP-type C4-dicarboxylate transport system substrate-binding protein